MLNYPIFSDEVIWPIAFLYRKWNRFYSTGRGQWVGGTSRCHRNVCGVLLGTSALKNLLIQNREHREKPQGLPGKVYENRPARRVPFDGICLGIRAGISRWSVWFVIASSNALPKAFELDEVR